MKNTVKKEFATKANGKFKCRVFDSDKRLVTETDWKPNLILDSGLDKIAHMPWAQTFQWCVAGTSNTPTKRELLADATWLGDIVSHTDLTFQFSASDVGRILHIVTLDTPLRITGFIDINNVNVSEFTVDPVASHIRIFYVEQTNLFAPHSMNMQYETSEGMCGTTITGTSIQMKRTFNFYMERTPVYIRELGFLESPAAPSNSINPFNPLFSRVVLDNPLYLSSGQFLQVSYELGVTLGPSTVTRRIKEIPGWPILPSTLTSGEECIQKLGMAIVGPDGVAIPYDEAQLCNEPYVSGTYLLGAEYGYVNRWTNSTGSSPTKTYDPARNNPFINRNTSSFDPRSRYYRENYYGQSLTPTGSRGQVGRNYAIIDSELINPWNSQWTVDKFDVISNLSDTIDDLMQPISLPRDEEQYIYYTSSETYATPYIMRHTAGAPFWAGPALTSSMGIYDSDVAVTWDSTALTFINEAISRFGDPGYMSQSRTPQMFHDVPNIGYRYPATSVLLPYNDSTFSSNWWGIDPYTHFPNVVPFVGNKTWDNWVVSGSITGSAGGPDELKSAVRGASVFLSNNSSSIAHTGSCVDRSEVCFEVPLVAEAYVAGSGTLVKKATFYTNMANRSDWRSFGIGPTSTNIAPIDRKNAAKYNGYVFLFDQSQTKLNTNNLDITFTYTWSRDYSIY